jgi:hypothetical protein
MSDETPWDDLLRQQRESWARGERTPVEAYQDRCPTLRDDPDRLLHFVLNEVTLREEQGETPTLEEYAARFPSLADGLRRRFTARRALREADLGPAPPTRSSGAEGAGASPAPFPTIPGLEVLSFVAGGGQGDVYRNREEAEDGQRVVGPDPLVIPQVVRDVGGRRGGEWVGEKEQRPDKKLDL